MKYCCHLTTTPPAISNGFLGCLQTAAGLLSFRLPISSAGPSVALGRHLGSNKEGVGEQNPQLGVIQLSLILRRIWSAFRAPLPLSTQPPLPHLAFLFRRALQVTCASLFSWLLCIFDDVQLWFSIQSWCGNSMYAWLVVCKFSC